MYEKVFWVAGTFYGDIDFYSFNGDRQGLRHL